MPDKGGGYVGESTLSRNSSVVDSDAGLILIHVYGTNDACTHWRYKINPGWNVKVHYVGGSGHYYVHCDDAIGQLRAFCSNMGYDYSPPYNNKFAPGGGPSFGDGL